MYPYIINGHYMYGNTFIQPRPPYYTCINHHKAPCIREMPGPTIYHDDGTPYEAPVENGTGELSRDKVAASVVNIETQLVKMLKITLYNIDRTKDITITMEIGKRYAVRYMTENGLQTADGYLRIISAGIPEECVKYIGNYTKEATQAYIGMDCSKKGVSERKLIYVHTIRYIEFLEDDADYEPPVDENNYADLSTQAKMTLMLEKFDQCHDGAVQITPIMYNPEDGSSEGSGDGEDSGGGSGSGEGDDSGIDTGDIGG